MSDHHHHDHDHKHDQQYCSTSNVPSFRAEEVIVKADVLAKAKELAEMIASSDEVHVFREAERKVTNHEEVQGIIKLIKKKQKEIVGFEYFKNDSMVQKIEAEIAELEEQLARYPIVEEFKQTQEDINYLMQLIIGVIRDTVSDKIAVESGNPADSAASCSD